MSKRAIGTSSLEVYVCVETGGRQREIEIQIKTEIGKDREGYASNHCCYSFIHVTHSSSFIHVTHSFMLLIHVSHSLTYSLTHSFLRSFTHIYIYICRYTFVDRYTCIDAYICIYACVFTSIHIYLHLC